ncbi:MAG: metallophosphoesterase [Gallionella sp.]|nr:metallophosphoesterase [Gallionella sp.]
MFGVILICVVTLMQFYVFRRAASVPFILRYLSRKQLFGISAFLWTMLVISRVIDALQPGLLATITEFIGMAWLGTLFLMLATLLLVEIATGFGFWFKPYQLKLRGAALLVGSVLSALALVQGTRAPIIQPYEVYLPDLPRELDGTVMVALTDMHLGSLLRESWLAERVAQVQAEKPDVVVLVGDIFEGHHMPEQPLLAGLSHLSAPMGVWAVLGNHESYGPHPEHTAMFKSAGAHLLRNTWVELRPGLVLAGIDNVATQAEADTFVTAALKGHPAVSTILLSHEPILASLPARQGVNLMLSGHTHGGQIWPFSYLVHQRFSLFIGQYTLADLSVIISRGTGTWGPRMRLWRPAEILRITLRRGVKASQ